MRNQVYSDLYQNYRTMVEEYKALTERIIKTKFEMSYLWKYKNDYPADWKKIAEKLSGDRDRLAMHKHIIRNIKAEMRKSNSDHPQN